jgi:lysophospholipase L1-like esterase
LAGNACLSGKTILIFEKPSKIFRIKSFIKEIIESGYQNDIIFDKKDSPTRIMVFGDSNACRPNRRDCWPGILQHISGKTILVINESFDGRTTRYDSGACNGLKVLEKKIRRALPLSWVIIALGTNDMKLRYGPPGPAEVAIGIDKLVGIIKRNNSGIQTLLLTPPSIGKVPSGDLAGAHSRIPPLVDVYHRYASAHHISIIDLYQNVDPHVDLEPDCVHLNIRGRRKVAELVWKNFQEKFNHVELV